MALGLFKRLLGAQEAPKKTVEKKAPKNVQKNKNTKIINVASTAAYNSYSDWTSYCAAKAGVIKISEGLSKSNFSVVTLCPGAIETKLRNTLNINNPNIMSIEEGIAPIYDAVNGKFRDSTIYQYRKNEDKFINGAYSDC